MNLIKQWLDKRKEQQLARENAAKWKKTRDEDEFRKLHKSRWHSVEESLEKAGFRIIQNSWGMQFPEYSRKFVVAPDNTVMLALLNNNLALNLRKL